MLVFLRLKIAAVRCHRLLVKRAKDALKNDPFIQHHKKWQAALDHMLKLGVRVEQQAFAKHGLNFVLDTYLPDKLKKNKFLP